MNKTTLIRVILALVILVVFQALLFRATRTYNSQRLAYEADQLIVSKQYVKARLLASQSVSLEPLNAVGHLNLATTDFLLGKHKESLEAFRRSLRTIGHIPNVLRLMGQAQYLAKQYSESAVTMDRYDRMVPEPTVAPEFLRFVHAQSLYRTDRHGEAAVVFAEAARDQLYQNEILQSRMINAILMNQHGFAGFAYRRLRSLFPNQPIDAQQLFSNALALGKTASAIAFLESVARRGDADGPLLKMLALAYVREKKPDQAISALQVALSMSGADHEVYVLLGDIYYEKKDVQRAKEYYEQHLRLSPQSPYRKDIETKLK